MKISSEKKKDVLKGTGVDHLERVRRAFMHQFGNQESPMAFRSPGRINLIGEHTDYNDGFVLPTSINKEIYLAVSPRTDSVGRLYAVDLSDRFEFDLKHIAKSRKRWANYLIGITDQLIKRGFSINGFDCAFGGDVPIGAGLSSSAAIETGLAFALNTLFSLGIETTQLAKISQASENQFVGVNCGIMDQFANLLGRKKSVFKLDCRTLEFSYYPFDHDDLSIVLCDTGVSRSLATSEYNLRRVQCNAGVMALSIHCEGIRNLRDVSLDMLGEHSAELDPVVYKRCKYVVEENERVQTACASLERGDMSRFGELLYASHRGLRDEYEVSCKELDFLVDASRGIPGVIGARMMGAGFGGCTLNLIEKGAVADFKKEMSSQYSKGIGKNLAFYDCELVSGTEMVED